MTTPLSTIDAPILLIDCRAARPALEAEGLTVRVSSSLDRAMRTLKAEDAGAVVLSGGCLEGRDIPETLQKLRRHAPRTTIFVWAPRLRSGLVRAVLMNGATDVVLERAPDGLVSALVAALKKEVVLPPLERLERARERGRPFHGLTSRSDAMWDLFETSVRVAPTDATVLILGETGTGKERIARALHKLSRRAGRWVAINCGAVPEALLESELFGHEKGAFTGAERSKTGLFRHADGGTLFLDEVGNMPLEAQFSLLRTLQEGTVRPVGAQDQIPVDVRIVAATNVPLEAAVAEGRFREDLLYRLDVIRLGVPALRERPEDILHLFSYFSRKFAKYHARQPPELTEAFMDRVLSHDWPGNVRQLENFVERLILTHRGKPLGKREFNKLSRAYAQVSQAEPKPAPSAPRAPVVRGAPDQSLGDFLDDAERQFLERALEAHGGRVQETSDAIKVHRRTLLRKLVKYGLDKREYRDRG